MKLCRETGKYFEESLQEDEDVMNLEILPMHNKQLRIFNFKSLKHVTYLSIEGWFTDGQTNRL